VYQRIENGSFELFAEYSSASKWLKLRKQLSEHFPGSHLGGTSMKYQIDQFIRSINRAKVARVLVFADCEVDAKAFEILSLLFRIEQPLGVTQIAGIAELSITTTERRLALLKRDNLINQIDTGLESYYTLTDTAAAAVETVYASALASSGEHAATMVTMPVTQAYAL
jgi:hypothetical protein